jgi:hypothetical protein
MIVPIRIIPPDSLERIVLDTNYRALTYHVDFLEMNKRSEIYVSRESYQYGLNDDQLVGKYRNFHVVNYKELKKYFPEGHALYEDPFFNGSFEIIGH